MSELKGGHLARSAAMLCQDADFRLYLDRAQSHKGGVHIPDGTHTEEDARDLILSACSTGRSRPIFSAGAAGSNDGR